MFQKLILFLVVLLLLPSCYDDFNIIMEEEIPAPPKTIVNTMLTGEVHNSDGTLLKDYTVDWTSGSIEVKEKHFIADLNQVNQLDQTLWIRKDDKIVGLGQWPLYPNDINHVSFQTFGEEKRINLVSNAALTERLSLNNVSGTGQVVFTLINDGSDLLGHGWSTSNELYALSDVDISMIDLPEGATTQLLVQDGFSLLKYDYIKAQWIVVDENNAVRGAGYYATAVIDDGIIASKKVVNNETAISYQWYEINKNRLGRSTAKGNWIQVLPASSEVIVDIVNPCLDIVNTEVIYTDDEPLDKNLHVNNEANLQTIATNIIDCDGGLVENSAIQVTDASGDQVLYFFAGSEIKTTVSVCNMDYTIAAYDPLTDQVGLDFPWSISTDDEIGYLSTCSDFVDGYSLFKVRDDVMIYNTFTYKKEGNKIILSSEDGNMKLIIEGDERGKYDVDMVNMKIYDPNFGADGYAVSCENSNVGCGIDDCYVSHLTETNEWVRVSFSGDVWMQTINPAKAGTYNVEGIIICKAD